MPFIGGNVSVSHFLLADHETTTHNNSMYAGTPYVAYFSASWCSHPHARLVDAVPADHLLILNLNPVKTGAT